MASGYFGNEAQEQLFLTAYHTWGSYPDFSLTFPSPYELGRLWHSLAFPLDSELANSTKQVRAFLPVAVLLSFLFAVVKKTSEKKKGGRVYQQLLLVPPQ